MSNTQPFEFVSTDHVVDDILRGIGLYTCGPDESAGWLTKYGPHDGTIHGEVWVSYRSSDNSAYPFTVAEITEITAKVKAKFAEVRDLEVYDVEYMNSGVPSIIVHWKTQRPFAEVINGAREALALSDASS